MDQIKIGVGVMIWQEGKLLLGSRLSKLGTDRWSFPGGHVEFGESPEQAAIRETKEETNLDVKKLEKLSFTSDIYKDGQHYITLFFLAREWVGTVKNMEPDKCKEWSWFSPDQLPEPLFEPIHTWLSENNLRIIQ
jgi:8-oxo-dGTP diphosphatase